MSEEQKVTVDYTFRILDDEYNASIQIGVEDVLTIGRMRERCVEDAMRFCRKQIESGAMRMTIRK